MKHASRLIILCAVSLFAILTCASAQEIKSGKVVFDFRSGNPKSAALHVKLIHQTYQDLAAAGKNPDFKVSFMGPAVKLISNNREGFTAEEQKDLDAIAEGVSVLEKDGIRLDVCRIAASVMKVDIATVLPAIKPTDNGWFSLIAYQSQGYSLVPIY